MPLWHEAHLQVKKLKTPHVRTTFGSCDVEKVHTVVARSTFRSQNVQSTPASDNFWKLRCRKSERRCGAKLISKSQNVQNKPGSDHFWKLRCRKVHAVVARSTFRSHKMYKTHQVPTTLLEVEMSKKCTQLWRKAHFEVKMYKTNQVRTTSGR